MGIFDFDGKIKPNFWFHAVESPPLREESVIMWLEETNDFFVGKFAISEKKWYVNGITKPLLEPPTCWTFLPKKVDKDLIVGNDLPF